MCCKLQHLGFHTFSEDQMRCNLQHLGLHALNDNQMLCKLHYLGFHKFQEEQILSKLQHLGSHTFGEDQMKRNDMRPWWFLDEVWLSLISFPLFFNRFHRFPLCRGITGGTRPAGFRFPRVLQRFSLYFIVFS